MLRAKTLANLSTTHLVPDQATVIVASNQAEVIVEFAMPAAPVTFGVRLARRESLRAAVVGLAVAGVCAAVAAFSGEARAFFLLPTLIPAALGVLFLGSVLVRRPVTGTLFNRLVGGFLEEHRDLAR